MTTPTKKLILSLTIAGLFFVSDIFGMGEFMAHQVHAVWWITQAVSCLHVVAMMAMVACAVQLGALTEKGAK